MTSLSEQEIIRREKLQELEKLGISIPVIAAGGIQPDDVEPLLQTGIDGIAISSAINLVADPAERVKEFYKRVY